VPPPASIAPVKPAATSEGVGGSGIHQESEHGEPVDPAEPGHNSEHGTTGHD
jgi:hypothetical protein